MNSRITAVVAAIAIAAAAYLLWPSDEGSMKKATLLGDRVKPSEPPPGMHKQPVPMPQMPRIDRTQLYRVYEEAKANGEEQPGDLAFRRAMDKFMEYNIEFAKAKMDEEGLTMKEVTELTYLGFKVMTSQAPDVIEDATGRKMSDDEIAQLVDLKNEANRDFTDTMRQLVKNGATEAERWAYIQRTNQNYMDQYFAITGMTPEQWDNVLAMGAVEPPEHVEPQPYRAVQARPGAPDKR